MVEIYINKRNITIRLTTTLQVLIFLIVLIHVSVSGFDASVLKFRLVVAGGEQAGSGALQDESRERGMSGGGAEFLK